MASSALRKGSSGNRPPPHDRYHPLQMMMHGLITFNVGAMQWGLTSAFEASAVYFQVVKALAEAMLQTTEKEATRHYAVAEVRDNLIVLKPGRTIPAEALLSQLHKATALLGPVALEQALVAIRPIIAENTGALKLVAAKT